MARQPLAILCHLVSLFGVVPFDFVDADMLFSFSGLPYGNKTDGQKAILDHLNGLFEDLGLNDSLLMPPAALGESSLSSSARGTSENRAYSCVFRVRCLWKSRLVLVGAGLAFFSMLCRASSFLISSSFRWLLSVDFLPGVDMLDRN